jgi:hypothetical protein
LTSGSSSTGNTPSKITRRPFKTAVISGFDLNKASPPINLNVTMDIAWGETVGALVSVDEFAEAIEIIPSSVTTRITLRKIEKIND